MASTMLMIPRIYSQTSPKIRNKTTNKLMSKASTNDNTNSIVKVRTLDGGKMQISKYNFDYNAQGGRAIGRKVIHVNDNEDDHDMVISGRSTPPVSFDVDLTTAYIPPLSAGTAKVDGWAPFPPFVRVDIVPELLQGNIYPDSGKVELKFRANLCVSIGSYKAPPLHMDTMLTSEELKGTKLTSISTIGKRLRKDGECTLVGFARMAPVSDHYINSILSLPTDCLVNLKLSLSF